MKEPENAYYLLSLHSMLVQFVFTSKMPHSPTDLIASLAAKQCDKTILSCSIYLILELLEAKKVFNNFLIFFCH